jgi:hypothetical protein
MLHRSNIIKQDINLQIDMNRAPLWKSRSAFGVKLLFTTIVVDKVGIRKVFHATHGQVTRPKSMANGPRA